MLQRWFLASLAALALTACGGGDDDTQDDSTVRHPPVFCQARPERCR